MNLLYPAYDPTPYPEEIPGLRLEAAWEKINREFDSKGFYLITDPDDVKNATELYSKKLQYICSCGREAETSYRNFKLIQYCMKCAAEAKSGKNHPMYNPDITDEERQIKRSYPEYFEWRTAVYERDNYSCQICGSKNGIEAHHKDGYACCRSRRTDVSNGATLCEAHHIQFHIQYGRGKNTEQQFIEFLNNIKKVS